MIHYILRVIFFLKLSHECHHQNKSYELNIKTSYLTDTKCIMGILPRHRQMIWRTKLLAIFLHVLSYLKIEFFVGINFDILAVRNISGSLLRSSCDKVLIACHGVQKERRKKLL